MGKSRGYIKKRSENSWSVVIYLGVDPVTGKKKQKWYTFPGTERNAKKELTRLLHEFDTGKVMQTTSMTVSEYLNKWLQDSAYTSVSEKTYERYQEIIKGGIIPGLGHFKLDKLRPLDIQGYYSRILKDGRKDGNGGLSERTVLHYHRLLHKALQQAVKWELLMRNPCDYVDPPHPKPNEMDVLDTDETLRLLDAAKGSKYYIPVLLAVMTGLRRGEILGLKWGDIDFENKTLAVRRTLQETRQGVTFKEPKTAKSRRLVVLSQIVVDALHTHKNEQQKIKDMLREGYSDMDLVCAQANGDPVIPKNLTCCFRDILKKAQLRHIRFHDLRHTHATIMLSQNVHPKIVSERLGHSTISITLDTYSHVLPTMQADAVRQFDDAFGAAFTQKSDED